MHMSWIARVLLAVCLSSIVVPFELVAQTEPPTTAIDDKEKKLSGIQRDIAVIKEATRLRLEAQEERVKKDLLDLQLRIEQQDSRLAAQLAAQQENLQQDLHHLQSRIEQQDSRIIDLHAATGRLGMSLTIFAVFITLLAAATGLAAWYSAGIKARETAQDWITRHESERNDDGRETMSEMRADVVRASQTLLAAATGLAAWYSTGSKARETAQERITRHESGPNDGASEGTSKVATDVVRARQTTQEDRAEIAAKAEQVTRQLQERLTAAPLPLLTPAQVEALDAQERHLKRIPESEYTFNDWESRAYAAYTAKQFDLASNFFLQASKAAATSGQVARSLVARGVMLAELNRSEEAIAVYEQVVARFGEATESVLREQVAGALLNKGVALGRQTRSQEAIAAYEQVVARFGGAPEPVLREEVAQALLNKGAALGRLTRSEEAIAAYGQVVARFGEATEPVLREQVVKALLNKGVALGRLNRSGEAIGVYEQVVARFGEATEPVLREGVGKALVNKGVTLGRLNRSEEAIAVYEQVVARFGSATELPFREGVAKALVNKGVALGRLTRSEEATAVYQEVVARFGEATEPVLREQVVRTFNSMGLYLLRKAKFSWHDTDARAQFLLDARSNFDRSLERDAQNSSTIGNLGYLLFLSGQREQATESLQYALTLGGNELYEDIVKDAETESVPDDAEFKLLLDKIWLEI